MKLRIQNKIIASDLAVKTIKAIKRVGADAAKMQTYYFKNCV